MPRSTTLTDDRCLFESTFICFDGTNTCRQMGNNQPTWKDRSLVLGRFVMLWTKAAIVRIEEAQNRYPLESKSSLCDKSLWNPDLFGGSQGNLGYRAASEAAPKTALILMCSEEKEHWSWEPLGVPPCENVTYGVCSVVSTIQTWPRTATAVLMSLKSYLTIKVYGNTLFGDNYKIDSCRVFCKETLDPLASASKPMRPWH